ncbi:MAG: preprotein translocase subunit SecG [Rhodomicrobiaceae bacterium]
MITVILVIHLMIASALVGVILVQRSEGGALGIGGGGGGLMSGRGAANLLTRITGTLAAAFFATSILLAVLAGYGTAPTSILDGAGQSGAPAGGSNSSLPTLRPIVPPSSEPQGPTVPQSQ